jgi:hypothetical protein
MCAEIKHAKELNIPVKLFSDDLKPLEYTEREPAFKYLIALADYFNVSIDYLVGRSDNPHIS